jgi:sugar phosphate isomerase/epimerase
MIALAYGTYGMADFSPPEAIDHIAAAGYAGIELTLADGYRDAAPRLDPAIARAVRERLAATGTGLVAILSRINVLGSAAEHLANLAILDEQAASGQACGAGEGAIITFTMGGKSADWLDQRDTLVDRLAALGARASANGTVLAVEPHVGGLVDSAERATWLIDRVGNERVRLNFDISHFSVPGLQYRTDALVDRLAPLAVHAHVKDSVATEDGFRFVLPGAGGFDYAAYFAAMQHAGWTRPITVEVSAMVFRRPDYDPLEAMRTSFAALDRARRGASTAPVAVRSS